MPFENCSDMFFKCRKMYSIYLYKLVPQKCVFFY